MGLVIPDDSAEAQEVCDLNIETIAVRVVRNFEVDRYNARERHWLYVVADCAISPVLYRVQDPAYKLAVKPRQSFAINFGDILREAEHD
jgi:hypothetical protein